MTLLSSKKGEGKVSSGEENDLYYYSGGEYGSDKNDSPKKSPHALLNILRNLKPPDTVKKSSGPFAAGRQKINKDSPASVVRVKEYLWKKTRCETTQPPGQSSWLFLDLMKHPQYQLQGCLWVHKCVKIIWRKYQKKVFSFLISSGKLSSKNCNTDILDCINFSSPLPF
ncbi:hypothetical protein NPIL_446201 [Nephila pilipes]|uniref:Uncharacterized protein n=1 Tax=Nephila pilipes TaxID=299642 RepID=A0A8X6PJN4_NEPPI|nr:hypothetical protein NPIL_446201 [Nephila pilipes]